MGCVGIPRTLSFTLERKVYMTFGTDFFKILNLVIQIMRLFAKVFGNDDEKQAVRESQDRTASPDSAEAC